MIKGKTRHCNIISIFIQQGAYLAKSFNKNLDRDFKYVFLGSMAQLGTFDAVVDLGGARSKVRP